MISDFQCCGHYIAHCKYFTLLSMVSLTTMVSGNVTILIKDILAKAVKAPRAHTQIRPIVSDDSSGIFTESHLDEGLSKLQI